MDSQLVFLARRRPQPEQPERSTNLQKFDFRDGIDSAGDNGLREPGITTLDAVFDPPPFTHAVPAGRCYCNVLAMDQALSEQPVVQRPGLQIHREEGETGGVPVEPVDGRERRTLQPPLQVAEHGPKHVVARRCYGCAVRFVRDENPLVLENDSRRLGSDRFFLDVFAVQDRLSGDKRVVFTESDSMNVRDQSVAESLLPDDGRDARKSLDEEIEKAFGWGFNLRQVNPGVGNPRGIGISSPFVHEPSMLPRSCPVRSRTSEGAGITRLGDDIMVVAAVQGFERAGRRGDNNR